MNITDTIARTHNGEEMLEVATECGLLNVPALTDAYASGCGERLWLAAKADNQRVGRDHGFSIQQETSGHYTVRDLDGEPVFGLSRLDMFVAAVEGALDALHAERTADGYRVSPEDRVAELRSFGVRAKALGEGTLLFVQPNAPKADVSVAMRNKEAPFLWDVAVANGADEVETVHAVEWADVVAIASECAF